MPTTYAIADDLSDIIETPDGFGRFPTKAAAVDRWIEFDRDCPDDVVTSKAGEAGTWGVEDIEEVRSDGQS